jgi:hypothetical protein
VVQRPDGPVAMQRRRREQPAQTGACTQRVRCTHSASAGAHRRTAALAASDCKRCARVAAVLSNTGSTAPWLPLRAFRRTCSGRREASGERRAASGEQQNASGPSYAMAFEAHSEDARTRQFSEGLPRRAATRTSDRQMTSGGASVPATAHKCARKALACAAAAASAAANAAPCSVPRLRSSRVVRPFKLRVEGTRPSPGRLRRQQRALAPRPSPHVGASLVHRLRLTSCA